MVETLDSVRYLEGHTLLYVCIYSVDGCDGYSGTRAALNTHTNQPTNKLTHINYNQRKATASQTLSAMPAAAAATTAALHTKEVLI